MKQIYVKGVWSLPWSLEGSICNLRKVPEDAWPVHFGVGWSADIAGHFHLLPLGTNKTTGCPSKRTECPCMVDSVEGIFLYFQPVVKCLVIKVWKGLLRRMSDDHDTDGYWMFSMIFYNAWISYAFAKYLHDVEHSLCFFESSLFSYQVPTHSIIETVRSFAKTYLLPMRVWMFPRNSALEVQVDHWKTLGISPETTIFASRENLNHPKLGFLFFESLEIQIAGESVSKNPPNISWGWGFQTHRTGVPGIDLKPT